MKKVFLTVLGTGKYSDCYYYKDDSKCRSKFVQEALLQFLYDKDDNVEVKILLTDEAKEKNFDSTNNDDTNLQTILENLNIYADLIRIPAGKTEEELWDIFEETINSIDDDSEITLDITHSLRNIPIQILVALNYTKLFKNINISGIYYGAYELGTFIDDDLNPGDKIKCAPICNLNVYYELLNWTNAINSFIHTGNSSEISQLYNKKSTSIFKLGKAEEKENLSNLNNLIKSLENFTQCINTCRGQCSSFSSNKNINLKSIGVAANNLYNNINILNNNFTIAPLKYLFEVVKEKISPFVNKSTLEIGMATIQWCIDYNLYQQGYTALDESLKTYICDLLKISSTKKYNREKIANTILNCLKIEYKNWIIDVENEEDKEVIIDTINILKKEKNFCELVNNIRERRNDINHFGFNSSGAAPYSKFITDLNKYYNNFLNIKESTDKYFICYEGNS